MTIKILINILKSSASVFVREKIKTFLENKKKRERKSKVKWKKWNKRK